MSAVGAQLRALYPEADAAALEARLDASFARPRPARAAAAAPWSERDALLITYADTLMAPGERPLRTLARFLEARLADAFSAVHLLPFYPATSDDGFAVSSYREVRPELGDWDDVKRIAERFDLMADLVLNHCSRAHPLARRLFAGDAAAAAWFHVVEPGFDARGVVRPRATPLIAPLPDDPTGRGVWTTFSADQVDFNYANPEVLLEVVDVLAQYLAMGARLLRLDAVAYLWKRPGTPCIHLPETHRVVRLLRALLERHAPGCRLVTETNVPAHENLSYFGAGDEAHLVYQFALPSLLLQALHRGSSAYLQRWLGDWPAQPPGATFLNFLASHDGIGVRPVERIVTPRELDSLLETMRRCGGRVSTRALDGGEERPYEINIALFDALRGTWRGGADGLRVARMLCAHAVLLSLPGIPAIYIHALLASPNDEAAVRRTGRARAINRARLDLAELERQLAEEGNPRREVFEGLLRLLRLRRECPAFAPGAALRPLASSSGFLLLLRGGAPEPALLAACNLTAEPQRLNLDLEPLGGPGALRDLIGAQALRVRRRQLGLEFAPYQCMWLTRE